jgi:hypothetical protein
MEEEGGPMCAACNIEPRGGKPCNSSMLPRQPKRLTFVSEGLSASFDEVGNDSAPVVCAPMGLLLGSEGGVSQAKHFRRGLSALVELTASHCRRDESQLRVVTRVVERLLVGG